MCQTGNGSIYKECRDAVFLQLGTTHVSNQEMRRIIQHYGGCLSTKAPKLVDKRIPVVVG